VTTTDEDLHDVHVPRQLLSLGLAVGVMVPGVVLRLGGVHLSDALDACLFGLAIVGAAFLLAWAAEVAQLDISAGLAIAILALIGVMPEYAVGFVFAGKGGQAYKAFGYACQSHADAVKGVEPPCSLALANMTGANRLLIGVGWSMVVFIAWWRWRKRGRRHDAVVLDRSHSVEIGFLAVATVYSLTLPLRRTIGLIDAVVLIGIFIGYTVRIARAPSEEPHLVGPSRYLGTFSPTGRRVSYGVMLVGAAVVIVLCADHFAEALVATGHSIGVSDFLLVQWLAPIASEAPELLVAGLYAWRLNTNAGLGTLVSSKVNQWTLLVGTMPIVFALRSGSLHGLPITRTPREELLLTAAQSVFAVAVLASLSISTKEAMLMFGLFWTQFAIGAFDQDHTAPDRLIFSVVYLLLGVYIVARDRGQVGQLLRDSFSTPYAELGEAAT